MPVPSDPNTLRRWLTLLTRAGGAQPIADDALTFQGSNRAEWLDLAGIFTPLALWDQNGFIDRALSTITFTDGTRTFDIAPTGVDYDFIQAGVTYTSTGDSIVIANTNGLHMIYYDAGALAQIVNPSDAQIETAIEDYCLVAFVMWDVTGATGYLMEERHGMNMAPATHHWIHDNVGAVWADGLALGNFTIGAGGANADAQFSTSAGEIYDEDVGHDIAAVAAATGLQIWYLDGANWRWQTNAGYSILVGGTPRMAFNNAGVQTEVNNNQFALCHVFATAGTDGVPIAIQGQAQYATRNLAQAGAETEIATLTTGTLPLPEIRPLGTVIFQTNNAYGNAVNSRVVLTGAGDNYVDWRTSPVAAGTAATDHGALAGLVDDDHLQYALLAGRAGGQQLTGGTAAGESLTLESTANATKGFVYLGSASAYDEANDRLGIGTLTPAFPIEVIKAGTNASAIFTRTGGVTNFINATATVGNFGTVSNHTLRLTVNSNPTVNIVPVLTAGNVGIGDVPTTSEKLIVTSTTAAFVPPRVTTAQRNAIAAITVGMIVFNLTTGQFNGCTAVGPPVWAVL